MPVSRSGDDGGRAVDEAASRRRVTARRQRPEPTKAHATAAMTRAWIRRVDGKTRERSTNLAREAAFIVTRARTDAFAASVPSEISFHVMRRLRSSGWLSSTTSTTMACRASCHFHAI